MSGCDERIREYLAGLIEIPMIFDGNCLCPDCLHYAMNVHGGTYECWNCGHTFPATIVVDKWGAKWLTLH